MTDTHNPCQRDYCAHQRNRHAGTNNHDRCGVPDCPCPSYTPPPADTSSPTPMPEDTTKPPEPAAWAPGLPLPAGQRDPGPTLTWDHDDPPMPAPGWITINEVTYRLTPESQPEPEHDGRIVVLESHAYRLVPHAIGEATREERRSWLRVRALPEDQLAASDEGENRATPEPPPSYTYPIQLADLEPSVAREERLEREERGLDPLSPAALSRGGRMYAVTPEQRRAFEEQLDVQKRRQLRAGPASNADPLWVRMIADIADQLWQAGEKRKASDLHEALRRSGR